MKEPPAARAPRLPGQRAAESRPEEEEKHGGSFQKTAWIVAGAHLALLGGLFLASLWHRPKPPEQIVWISGGEAGTPGQAESDLAEAGASEQAPSPVELQMIEPVEVPPVLESIPEAPPVAVEPLPPPAASELVVPRATPPPLATPRPTPKATPKPTPAATPKPTPVATPKPKPATPKSVPKATPAATPAATPKASPAAKVESSATPKTSPAAAKSSPGKTSETAGSNPAKSKPATAGGGGSAGKSAGPKGSGGSGTTGQGKGENGTGGGTGAGPGSPNGWYFSMIHERFYGAWQQPTSIIRSTQKFSTKLKIRIARDGAILRREVVGTSGNTVMDDSVLEAAQQVTQIDALPAGLGTGEYFDVAIDFKLDQDQ